jgi:hypothetical protein
MKFATGILAALSVVGNASGEKFNEIKVRATVVVDTIQRQTNDPPEDGGWLFFWLWMVDASPLLALSVFSSSFSIFLDPRRCCSQQYPITLASHVFGRR